MTNRIDARFAELRSQRRAGLITYVMGADPDWDSSLAIVRTLINAGADIIELGFPFSDPMADGPSIQAAADRALKGGATLRSVLKLAAEVRAQDASTPLVLMGYLNPVEQMGVQAFATAAATAGADGVILVDLPPEEDGEIRAALAANGLALIRFATPTTDDDRLQAILDGASGFVYYVSVAGVTGQKAAPAEASRLAVARIKAASHLPVAVGFGVRDAASAAQIAKTADAVVVGSALVDVIGAEAQAGHTGEQLAQAVGALATSLSAAVRSAQQGA